MTTLSKWRPVAYILPLEHRTCKACQTTYTCPSPLRVQITTSRNTTRLISIHDFAARLSVDTRDVEVYHTILPTLPRLVEHVHTSINICPHCFQTSTKSQSDFWPQKPPNTMSVASIEAQRKRDTEPTIKPATVDDI